MGQQRSRNLPCCPSSLEPSQFVPNDLQPFAHNGIILGANIAAYLAKKAGKDPEIIWDMLILVVVLAIIGARIYHVFSRPSSGLLGWDYYKENPLEALYIWNGGLGIYGAIVGAAAFKLLYDLLAAATPQYWQFWLGLILVLLVLFVRGGVLGLLTKIFNRATGKGGAA